MPQSPSTVGNRKVTGSVNDCKKIYWFHCIEVFLLILSSTVKEIFNGGFSPGELSHKAKLFKLCNAKLCDTQLSQIKLS